MYGYFERLLNPFPNAAPQTPPKTLYAFCRHYARGAEKYLILMSIFTGLLAVIEVSLYGFVGRMVDWLNTQSPESLFSAANIQPLIFAIATLVILPFVVFIQSTLMHQTLLGNFPMIVRWLAHRYLLGHSLSFYHNEFAGRLATKVMQTALAVRETVMKLLDVMLYVAVYFVSVLALVASLDWRLAIPFIVWLISYGLLLKYFLPRLARVSQKQADARSIMTGRLVDTYTNMTTVKLFSHSTREETYAREGMQTFLNTVHPQMRLGTSLTTAVWTASALLILSVILVSLWLWSLNLVTTGAIAIATALVLRLNGMSHWVMWEISGLFENIGTVKDGIDTLTIPQNVIDSTGANTLNYQQGHIHFNKVRFAYNDSEPVINNFSLTIKPGEKIGLVGRSGAGKSTLVNLLLRFYDINSGSILIDDQDIRQIQQDSLRQHIGMVTQDTSLLHRSIRENLSYGRPESTEDELLHAVEKASALDFIAKLRDAAGREGLDAYVGERGVTLSGGQRQRIAIARVMLKNAPILILDEATSALDSEVEHAIQQNLETLMDGKTVIAIAHRLSTIATLDRLIVIDNGEIVEQGHHNDLVQQGGLYARLWQRQSGGFLAES